MKILISIPSNLVDDCKQKAGAHSLQAYLINLAKADIFKQPTQAEKSHEQGNKKSI